MGCMLRSDPMTQCDMFLQPDSAFMVLSRLGELGCVQFRDLNEELNAFQRTYVMEVCRCAEMERKLRFIGDKMVEDEIYIPKLTEEPLALNLHDQNTYENTIEKWERVVQEMTTNLARMNKTYLELTELRYVLVNMEEMLGNADVRTSNLTMIRVEHTAHGQKLKHQPHVSHPEDEGGNLTVITGLVQRKRSYNFQVMLWRVSHGCAYYTQSAEDEIFKDPMSNANVRKVAFLLVVQGEALGRRIKKVCEGFRCDLYPMPPTAKERQHTEDQVETKIDDVALVVNETRHARCKAMRAMARAWPTYLMQIKKAKAVYHVMNYFRLDITKKCLIGRCWIPTADMPIVHNVLEECSEKMKTTVPCFMSKINTRETAPTFHRTNRFTYGFQALISAYGDSTYRELNPAKLIHNLIAVNVPSTISMLMLFNKNTLYRTFSEFFDNIGTIVIGLYTIVTFPFLFSLMFGDLGHGLIMFAAAFWMVWNEKKLIAERSESEIWIIFFGGRYIMLLMSLFSIYAGLIYNDCFSKSFTIFPPGWRFANLTMAELHDSWQDQYLLDPTAHRHAYYFGKDPLWELAKNKILFENSLKMKLSIVVGVIHMIFGLTLSLFNDIFFKEKRYLIFLEFIPQLLFLMCIFLWLVILIFIKWFKYGGARQSKYGDWDRFLAFSPLELETSSEEVGQTCAPLVLILFIDMVLMTKSKPVGTSCKEAYMFSGQQIVQQVLLFLAVICVPIMLIGPPCYANQANIKKRKALMKKVPDKSRQREAYENWEEEMEHTKHTFADFMIHQAVHTIEFVLSTISHTASYLRLWALSLAHAQLSEMLWGMIFSKMALQDHTYLGAIKIVLVFAIWAFFTVAILVLMEGLSAFLHTLRLHWVEFMSKFFEGLGVMFKPFSFAILFADATKEKMEVCPAPQTFEY